MIEPIYAVRPILPEGAESGVCICFNEAELLESIKLCLERSPQKMVFIVQSKPIEGQVAEVAVPPETPKEPVYATTER